MEFLGIWGLDDELNATNAPVISIERASVRLRVIPTDEELMIAQSVAQFSKP
jgi:acetate kinase